MHMSHGLCLESRCHHQQQQQQQQQPDTCEMTPILLRPAASVAASTVAATAGGRSRHRVFLSLLLLLLQTLTFNVQLSTGQTLVDVGDTIAENDIVVVNTGIQVPFGRSVYLDPRNHLNIAVRPGDTCVLKVLQNDPLSQRPGKINPSDFLCQFGFEEVQYSHFGSRTPLYDRVQLLLRYDTKEDTLIIPLVVQVKVTFEQQQVLIKNLPLIVDKPGGISNTLDTRVLQFAFDRRRETCRLLTFDHKSAFSHPKHGRLTNVQTLQTDDRGMVDCDQFLKANIHYQHMADAKSPNRDRVAMWVQLRDADGNEVKQEYFQVTVRIKGTRENAPPRLSDQSLLLMDVNQFVMTPITVDILNAYDEETDSAELVFNVTSALGYGEGHIVSTDDQNLPISSFTKKDVESLKIAYRPPSSDSDVRRIFPVHLEVIDSEGLASDPFTLLVTVNPMNSLAPLAVKCTGISLFEGQSRRLQSSRNLEITDEDNVDNVVITVAGGLQHGQLMLLDTPVKQFSPADLDAGLIRYQHDGSDTYTDNIIFHMSDGEHHVQFLFPVTIFPQDDEPPILTINTGLTLQRTLEGEITPFVLSAADVDSDDDDIKFVMVEPEPLYGEIYLRRYLPPQDDGDSDDRTWTDRGGDIYEGPVQEWTQQDINDGLVFYRHLGHHHTRTVMDAITFQLTDSGEPPNVSKEKQFLVSILPLDDHPPEVHPQSSLQITVKEYELAPLTSQNLRYTDADSDDRLLRFTVVTPPSDLDPNSPSEPGKLVLSEDPDTEVSTFTQAQINHHKIAYRPPPVELGLVPRMIQFQFQVEDQAGNTLPNQVFTISILPIDNQPPKVFTRPVKVVENGMVPIGTDALDASDPDTDQHHLTFRLTHLPHAGVLQFHSINMTVGDVFNRQDLQAGSLSYVNRGDEHKKDQFQVEVTDGAHHVPGTVHLSIRSVDDEPPAFVIKPGSTILRLECLEGNSVTISADVLSASDPDTDDRKLTFLLETPPRQGDLNLNGRRVTRFTQDQIRKGMVQYRHKGGEIGPEPLYDAFNLSLSDMSKGWSAAGNRIQQIKVNVSIEPLDNNPPNVTIKPRYVVPEGQKRPLGPSHIQVTDADTDDEHIVCTILEQPKQGYVENIGPPPGSERQRTGIPLTAFRVSELVRGKVNYVQSIHWGIEPRKDRFVIQCSDGINFSPPQAFPVTITPTNDERPQMVVSEFSVIEGMLLHIDQMILNAVDADQPDDRLTFRVIKRPKHGKIVLQSPDGVIQLDQFDVTSLRGNGQAATVAYSHDDSETTEDDFELELTDGNPDHTARKVISISIIPTDDETPRLSVNNGLEVDILETKVITNRNLKAEDLDSEDSNLTYVVRSPPYQGGLVKVNPLTGDLLQNITKGKNFTQQDIDQQTIAYVHTGQEGGRDVIKLDVTDGFNPLIDCYFYVTIEGADAVHPDVINKGVQLPEGGMVTLTTDILSTSDLNSDDGSLKFVVTRGPTRGHLQSTDMTGLPITSFTQLDLAGNKIRYIHTSDDEIKMDSFEFEVTDGHNSVYRTFRITLNDVDNKKPVLFVGKLTVREGGHKLVTPFELKLEDADTSDDHLQFVVTRAPLHGTVMYNRTQPINAFTMADVQNNLISYQHDGSETTADKVSFVVTDGVHDQYFVYPEINSQSQRPQTLTIDIIPVDNGIPHLMINRGATALGLLYDQALWRDLSVAPTLGFQFTNRVLKAQDRDSPESELLYVITSPAKHGHLFNRLTNHSALINFTQGKDRPVNKD